VATHYPLHRFGQKIHETIKASMAMAVSSGSFQDQSGACAWLIESDQSTDWVEGLMTIPGGPGVGPLLFLQ